MCHNGKHAIAQKTIIKCYSDTVWGLGWWYKCHSICYLVPTSYERSFSQFLRLVNLPLEPTAIQKQQGTHH